MNFLFPSETFGLKMFSSQYYKLSLDRYFVRGPLYAKSRLNAVNTFSTGLNRTSLCGVTKNLIKIHETSVNMSNQPGFFQNFVINFIFSRANKDVVNKTDQKSVWEIANTLLCIF